MAGDWIPMRCHLADEPEVLAAVESLSMDPHTIVGKLHCLWSWFDQHTKDGMARGVTPAQLNARVRCEKFLENFTACGWFSVTQEGVRMHKFSRYLSQGGKQRVLAARRASRFRNANRNAPTVTKSAPTEQNRTEENIKKATPSKVTPPTVEEVAAYCAERKNTVDAQQFVDHYTSNGWRIGGKSPMKDWRAAVRTWEKNSFNRGGTHASRNPIPAGPGQKYDGKPLGKF